jgi:two-component system, chemotaxis family, CheB/CheR fusion protein
MTDEIDKSHPDPDVAVDSAAINAQVAIETHRCLVVGMGASAGGIEAFSQFFDAMPPNSGAAFVVVLHLDPTRESQMALVLSTHTKMQVVQVEDQMPILPDHVYVIAPDRDLSVKAGVLHLTKPAEKRGHRHPVDVLFRSLAADQGERVIAIVLSGTGSNGTDGLKEVRAAGGLILVQDPSTAKFDGMPRSAIAAGMADHILAPGAMPAVLGRYFNNEYIAEPFGGEAAQKDAQPLIDQILTVLRTRTGHNFGSYRRSTLQRRIQRRLGLKNIPTLEAYLVDLRSDPAEAAILIKDLLINVTSFFRDAEAWSTLCELVIAPLVAARETGAHIRAWVPGCSTGEEAYTLAMLIAEQATLAGKAFDVKIFATDAREDNLNIAREGVYPVAAITGLDATRQRRFFEAFDATYRVKKDLRATVIFAPQNLLRDPPFSHLDLITCRNLLIYLEPEAQQGVIALFHFALEQGGALMLGNTETVGRHSGVFGAVSKKWRIYKRLGATRLDIVNFPVLRGQQSNVAAAQETMEAALPATIIRAADLARRALLDRFAPAAVLIDAANIVVYFHGSTSAYLEQPTGEPSNDLFVMARGGLGAKLRSAVRKAKADACEVSFEAALLHRQGHGTVAVTVSPVLGQGRGHLLVSFIPVTAGNPHPVPQLPEILSQDMVMRDELVSIRFELQTTIEHLETANEELKASNEEATSMNEELQSTNEELETSKEEMQSFNEELHTVNGQLQANIRDLEDSTNDLNNLLAGTESATLFIDTKLCIKWFTPGTQILFDFRPADIGRPLQHFALKFDDGSLLADAERVLHKLQVLETEVASTAGRWYMRRMLPYRTLDNRIAGVVITFFDVTESNIARDASTEARIFSQAIVETVRKPLLVLDHALKVISVNPAFEALFGVIEAKIIGKLAFNLAKGEWSSAKLRGLLQTLILNGQPFNDTVLHQSFPRLGLRELLMSGRKMLREGGRPSLVLLSIEDVTERRLGQQAARKLAAIVDSSRDAIISINLAGEIVSWNTGAEEIFGYLSAEIVGKPLIGLEDPDHLATLPDTMAHFREGGETLHYERPRIRKDGSTVWVAVTESPLRDDAGVLLAASSIARDITEQRITEQHRKILVDELNHRVKNSLAIVQAIASQTLRGDVSLPDARKAFGARLAAFARAHDLLVTENWAGSDLASVIKATIAPHDSEQSRFHISGPFVTLAPQGAVTFSLALHELCTNAAKYGALSVPEGRVDIVWSVSGDAPARKLAFRWAESGGPPVLPPKSKGFGSSLIERALPMELSGEARVTYPIGGVVFVLDAPLPS